MDNRTINEIRKNETNLINEIKVLEQENQELKKQLDDCKNGYKKHLNNQLSEDIEPDPEDFYLAEIEGKANDYDKLVAQQKVFIKYLADDIKEREKLIVTYHPSTQLLIEQIIKSEKKVLSKYKRIIGETKND